MTTQRSSILETELVVTDGHHANGGGGMNGVVSEALYWEKYYESVEPSYEWNNGQLEVMPMSDYAKYVMYLWFLDVLRDFLHVHPIARIIGLEVGFRLALPTKTTIRKPDLGLVLNSNRVPLAEHDRSYHGVFDLCIESLSDGRQTEIDRDTITKLAEYTAAGVQEYYILDERGIETQFYRLSRRGRYELLPRTNGVVRSLVLPGFQFRISDLYDQPAPPQMVQDPVYSAFISPLYRAERQRADQERERADQERERADQERERADQERERAERAESLAAHYAALLKAAGLLPPR
jgi:Uma2 family endonuclease